MREVFCEILQKKLFLPEKCERIVSFSPAITEALFEIGLEDKIKAVSTYCVRPKEARKKIIIGSYSTFKKEKLDEIKPDLIFTTTGYQLDLANKLLNNYPVYAIRLPATISDLIATCCEAGLVAGYFEEARNLQKYLLIKLNEIINSKSSYKVIAEKGKKSQQNNPTVYLEIDLGGPVTFGAYSYITDALNFIGFKNIFDNYSKEWLTPDDNYVKDKSPDIIIYEPKMFSKKRNQKDIIDSLTKRFGEIKAIKYNNIFITPGIYDFLAHHGPSFINEVIPWLVSIKMKCSFSI